MDGWLDESLEGWLDGRMDTRKEVVIGEWINSLIDGRVDG